MVKIACVATLSQGEAATKKRFFTDKMIYAVVKFVTTNDTLTSPCSKLHKYCTWF